MPTIAVRTSTITKRCGRTRFFRPRSGRMYAGELRQNIGLCCEIDAVIRQGDAGALQSIVHTSVVAEPDLLILMINAGIGRGDMRVIFIRTAVEISLRLGMEIANSGCCDGESAVFEFEWIRFMQFPRTAQMVAAGQPDRTPFMVGEIKQVFCRGIFNPVGQRISERSLILPPSCGCLSTLISGVSEPR